MPRKSLSKPDSPGTINEARAAAIAADWLKLEEQRLALGRKADGLKKRQDAIEGELLPFVEANSKPAVRSITLAKVRLSIHQMARGLYWKGIVEELLTPKQIATRQRKRGTYEKLFVEAIAAVAAVAKNAVGRTDGPRKPSRTKAPAPGSLSVRGKGRQKPLDFAA